MTSIDKDKIGGSKEERRDKKKERRDKKKKARAEKVPSMHRVTRISYGGADLPEGCPIWVPCRTTWKPPKPSPVNDSSASLEEPVLSQTHVDEVELDAVSNAATATVDTNTA